MAINEEEITSEVWNDLFIDNIGSGIFEDSQTENDHEKNVDLAVTTRFPLSLTKDKYVEIELASHKSSSRDLVGLQLWRGAFLLAEYLCHRQDLVKNSNILELAAGTGFTSIVAALTARKVICTDVDRGSILSLIHSNFECNASKLQAEYKVDEIDFFKANSLNSKLEADLKDINLIICADVVYNADITRAFFKTLKYLSKITTKESISVIISLEKRLWMDLDGEIIAPSYEVFLECLHEFESSQSNVLIQEIPIDFPHVFQCFRFPELS